MPYVSQGGVQSLPCRMTIRCICRWHESNLRCCTASSVLPHARTARFTSERRWDRCTRLRPRRPRSCWCQHCFNSRAPRRRWCNWLQVPAPFSDFLAHVRIRMFSNASTNLAVNRKQMNLRDRCQGPVCAGTTPGTTLVSVLRRAHRHGSVAAKHLEDLQRACNVVVLHADPAWNVQPITSHDWVTVVFRKGHAESHKCSCRK
mmetsp:Transcript_30998/g.82376  ORF Transcript_30998/g.82376 Transcript_30998/m.82376 type:complete len:203 (+) Transcript_30998:1221-1829(+)